MFPAYFSTEPIGLDMATAQARRCRQREVENALLSHLVSGYQPTGKVIATLQQYINGEKLREKAFGMLYEAH